MENKSTDEGLKNILTEIELMELLGLKKSQMAALRLEKRLPFLRISKTSRLYLESDIVFDWLKKQSTVLNEQA